ncbi:hypothetical protein EWM64_g9517, partial [Hericium alpestre]
MSANTLNEQQLDTELEKGPRDKPESSRAPSIIDNEFEVTLDPSDDPQRKPLLLRWLAVLTISSASVCVTCASSAASFSEAGIQHEFGISKEVAILGISLFVMGLGVGPLLIGPLSEMYGRNIVYRVSFVLFFAFSWPVAFAPNIAVYLIFRFLTGYCGAAFLSVAGGSVSDMFPNNKVATPMAVYTISPFLGPEIGPLYSGLRKRTGNPNYYAPIERTEKNLAQALLVSIYKPFQLIIYERMALLLNLWTSLILGILYLAFQAFPIIFEQGHGFNVQMTGLTFLGIGLGMAMGLATQPYWNRKFREYKAKHGDPPPEFRLKMGQVGGILVPIGLYWLAFTTYRHVHWIVPIIASIPFGTGTYFVFTSVFTYLVVAYRP